MKFIQIEAVRWRSARDVYSLFALGEDGRVYKSMPNYHNAQHCGWLPLNDEILPANFNALSVARMPENAPRRMEGQAIAAALAAVDPLHPKLWKCGNCGGKEEGDHFGDKKYCVDKPSCVWSPVPDEACPDCPHGVVQHGDGGCLASLPAGTMIDGVEHSICPCMNKSAGTLTAAIMCEQAEQEVAVPAIGEGENVAITDSAAQPEPPKDDMPF
jgi:hypothetical protein